MTLEGPIGVHWWTCPLGNLSRMCAVVAGSAKQHCCFLGPAVPPACPALTALRLSGNSQLVGRAQASVCSPELTWEGFLNPRLRAYHLCFYLCLTFTFTFVSLVLPLLNLRLPLYPLCCPCSYCADRLGDAVLRQRAGGARHGARLAPGHPPRLAALCPLLRRLPHQVRRCPLRCRCCTT